MSMLHTVNKSPFERNALDSCLRTAKKGGSILLIEDGVYAALQGTKTADNVAQAMSNFSFYVLGPDIAARGMAEGQVIEGIKIVDYDGFVDLVAEHETLQSWL
ncbi:MAG: sulfurtransferase complex subunit TusB [Gammaproteobacteria bacterium]|nr:sulfurtransferase complex subunit TusB [Gammaproteobacteria bacterium]